MGLQYVFGGAGAGKTAYCVKQITSTSLSPESRAVIYIVPEQFTLESEKSLCAAAKGGAVTAAQVLSFQRLAFRLFAEAGAGGGKLLDDAGKNMLLRKITLELAGELRFFGKAAEKQGFIDSLHETVREFYQYGVDAPRLSACAARLSGSEPLRRKMDDLCKIYARFQEAMGAGYISAESALDLVPERVEGSALLAGSRVFIDGFNGFTPQEYRIIQRLLRTCAEVTVCLTVKSDRLTHEEMNPADPFYEIKRAVNRLTALAAERGAALREPLYLTDSPRFALFPELAHLEKNFFSYHKNEYEGEAENIQIFAAENAYEEMGLAAENILRLVRDEGFRYGDIALAAADPASYEMAAQSVFGRFGIPYFIDTKANVLSHPLVELIRAAVDIVAWDWSYEAVFRFLKTDLTGLSRDDVDTLENYALAYGVSGWKWRMEQWTAGFGDDSGGGFYDRERIHALKERVTASLAPFAAGGRRRTVRDYAAAVFGLLEALNVGETLARWADDSARRGDQETSALHSQIWGKNRAVFEKLVDILGEEEASARTLAKILDAGYAATDMGLIPPACDQVVIGDLERSRLPGVKALLVVGACEGVLPGGGKETGLFADSERELLRGLGVELAPDSRRKSYAEQYLVYACVTKPSRRLIISYHTGTLSGKATRPSPLVAQFRRLFPRMASARAASPLTRPAPMLEKMGALLRRLAAGESVPPAWEQAYRWFGSQADYNQPLAAIEAVARGAWAAAALGPASVDSLYPDDIVTGVSRLEQYAKCPFSHFAEHGLRARPRQLYEATSLDFGNFYHQALESFADTLAARGESWRDADEERISEIVEAAAREIAPALSGQVLLSTAKFRHSLERAARVTKRSVWALAEHLRRGLFEPVGWEVAFGRVAGEEAGGEGKRMDSLAVPIDERRRFLLTGRIDRVDMAVIDGERYIKVIDYKSGSTRFDMNELRLGVQLQLMVYCHALIKNGGALLGEGPPPRPGGVFYFSLNDPVLAVNEPAAAETVTDMALRAYKMSGVALKDERVIRAMDGGVNGHSALIPVQLTGKGFGKTGTSAATREEFGALLEHAAAKAAEIGRGMVRGDIAARPYKNNKRSACDYCDYKSVCGLEAGN